MSILRSTLCAAGLAVLGARAAQAADYWFYVTAESADEVYLVRFDGKEAKIEKRIESTTRMPTKIPRRISQRRRFMRFVSEGGVARVRSL